MVSINYPLCSSSSNVLSWKILLEEWTQAAEGDCVSLPFAIVAPTDGKIIQLKLEVYPKGFGAEGPSYASIDVGLGGANILEDIHPDLGQFQIETAYRIKHKDCDWPMDFVNSRSVLYFHSSLLHQTGAFYWLADSYEIGTVEDRAQDGFLVFELEIRTFSAPRMKFKSSGSKEEFLNNFQTIDSADGDVKLICETKEFHCHKFLLISQSPVFKAMFQIESKEKEQNVVNIVDCGPEVMEEFVRYLYKGVMSSAKPLELMFGLLNLANKYQVDLLKAECVDLLMDMMDVDNVLRIFAVVDKIVPQSDVNDMVIDFVKKNLKVIVKKEDWFSFLSDYPSLATDLVLNMHQELNDRNDLKDEDE